MYICQGSRCTPSLNVYFQDDCLSSRFILLRFDLLRSYFPDNQMTILPESHAFNLWGYNSPKIRLLFFNHRIALLNTLHKIFQISPRQILACLLRIFGRIYSPSARSKAEGRYLLLVHKEYVNRRTRIIS